MWSLLVPIALAGTEVSLGFEQNLGDPDTRRGLRATGGLGLTPAVSVGVTAAAHPRFASTWSGIDEFPTDNVMVSPVVARGLAWGRVAPVRSERGPWRTDLGLEVGFGAVCTRDLVPALITQNWPTIVRGSSEWSPAVSVAVSSTAWRGTTGLRLRLERAAYDEKLDSVPYDAAETWVGVDLVVGRYK